MHGQEDEHQPQRRATRHLFQDVPPENPLTAVKWMLQNPPLHLERGTSAKDWLTNVEQLVDTACHNAMNRS